MNGARVYLLEAWHELREGLRSPLVPLMFVGLVGYVFLMLLDAEYLRDMGAADVPRNSAHVIFQMTSGQAFWLIFAWAWVFAQIVVRDRAASLHEVVLAAPVSLPGLLLARYAGAVALGCLLGSSSSVGFLLVPALGMAGVLPPEAVGPTPYAAIGWAWLLFVLPSALGLGALYLIAALRTRSSGGPFAVAAAIILVWMGAMIVLRRAGAHTDLATLIDASGFGEAELQTKRWTPIEKAGALLELTPALQLNRIVWTALPLALLGLTLRRQRRDGLVLERGKRARPAAPPPARQARPAAPAQPPRSPVWPRALLLEAGWHLRQSLSGQAFWVTAALWALINIAAPYAHMQSHAEGPLIPRAELLAPFLLDLCYVFSVFVVAGFVGLLARRDQRTGFEQIIDVTPAPLGTRVLARALAAAAVTLLLALIPAFSAWVVMAISVRDGFDLWTPLWFDALVAAPALFEICGATFLIHALVRSSGSAHALSMFAAFVALVNHEIELVSYPPAQVGVPAHVVLSELAGTAPWQAPVLALDALKLSLFVLLVALAWAVYPRGTALGSLTRARAAAQRLWGGAGVLALASVTGAWMTNRLLHERLVALGAYRSPSDRRASDAAWERQFWAAASPFSVRGGEVRADIDVAARRARALWTLRGVEAPSGTLIGSLRTGMRVVEARSEGLPRPVQMAHDHFAVDLGACPEGACDVELTLDLSVEGWPVQAEPPWLDGANVWARAADLLPRLGLDGERALRAPALRREQGLGASLEHRPAAALASRLGVAPAGDWRWSIALAAEGARVVTEGSCTSALDFAVFHTPPGVATTLAVDDISVVHGPSHRQAAAEIAEDLRSMQRCIEREFGMSSRARTVLQAPRGLGDTAVHGSLLWLPEHEGWDVATKGPGRVERRARLAAALAADWIGEAADLRAEPGSRWLTDGVAGWVGLECVRATDGSAAWLALLDRRSDRVVDALGALNAPLVGLADDGDAEWVRRYAPLAVTSWSQRIGAAGAVQSIHQLLERVRLGEPLRAALGEVVGPDASTRLLGTPFSSDVSLESVGEPGLAVRGERFSWSHGGWQPGVTSFDVVQRFDDDGRPPLVTRVPTTLSDDRPFAVFDDWPSFERSPLDNVYEGTSRLQEATRLAR